VIAPGLALAEASSLEEILVFARLRSPVLLGRMNLRLDRFRRAVSARKIPVSASVETGFDDCVVGSQFDIYCLHHPVLRNQNLKASKREARFLGHFS
jgi:hypothetical protein